MVELEVLIVFIFFALGLWPVVALLQQGRSSLAGKIMVALLIVTSVAGAWIINHYNKPPILEQDITFRPIEVKKEGYTTSSTCRACHPREYATWHHSYHRTMTQIASPRAVISPFKNVKLDWHGRTYHLDQRGDEFWVEMDDPDWTGSEYNHPRVERRIVLTTGSHSLQGYWYETPVGRKIEQLPFVFRIDDQKWIPDFASFIRPPWPEHEKFPVAGPADWSVGCIRCHVTSGQPRLDMGEAGTPDSHVTEFGISCESCHGPAEQHVRVNRDPTRRYQFYFQDGPDSTIVNPNNLNKQISSQVCGQCHSVFVSKSDEEHLYWREKGYRYQPGDDLTDTRITVHGILEKNPPYFQKLMKYDPDYIKDRFWSDGMVRIAGREYNGLLESPCYQRGELTCLSCHTMHKQSEDSRSMKEWANDQLSKNMDSNVACLQCHESYAKNIRLHTHHASDSTGSLCYNCHMPYTTYGLHKAIRSHQIDSPTVSASLETGRPNACNQCHLDKTLLWSAKHLRRWYGQPVPIMNDDEKNVAASLLWLLQGDAGQRAIMAWNLSWNDAIAASGNNWLSPFLIQLLLDPYDAVRFIAYRSLRKQPGFKDFETDCFTTYAERYEIVKKAGRIWNRIYNASKRTSNSEILFDPQGNLHIDEINRLLKLRNDRPMMLAE